MDPRIYKLMLPRLVRIYPRNRHAIASEELVSFDGPYWMTINLARAWNSTLFCDPKGDVTDETGKGLLISATLLKRLSRTLLMVSDSLAPGIRQRKQRVILSLSKQRCSEPVHVRPFVVS